MASASEKNRNSDLQPPKSPAGYFFIIGPGLVLAATGVGAGDMVAATVAGSAFGLAVAWACVLGAVLKFVLSENVARWQLATGTSVVEGWADHLPWIVRYYFLVYLVFWTVWVGAALMAACGLAAHAVFSAVMGAYGLADHAVFSFLTNDTWAVLHSVAALLLVIYGRYTWFENAMKVFIGVMFVSITVAAVSVWPGLIAVMRAVFVPAVPRGSFASLLAVVGGVGGTVTLLSYGYWINEHRWKDARWLKPVRVDLGTAYILTGTFGAAIIILASQTLHAAGAEIEGKQAVLKMAAMLEQTGGRAGWIIFLLGFWGAVASSMLGVWQGVPYLFADLVGIMKGADHKQREGIRNNKSPWYRGYLLFISFAPMPLLLIGKPVGLSIAYAAIGSFFMPFLGATLLYMNNQRQWLGPLRNRIVANAFLVVTEVLFIYVGVVNLLKELAQ